MNEGGGVSSGQLASIFLSLRWKHGKLDENPFIAPESRLQQPHVCEHPDVARVVLLSNQYSENLTSSSSNGVSLYLGLIKVIEAVP